MEQEYFTGQEAWSNNHGPIYMYTFYWSMQITLTLLVHDETGSPHLHSPGFVDGRYSSTFIFAIYQVYIFPRTLCSLKRLLRNHRPK